MTTTLTNSFEDERTFRDISFKWSVAWDKKDISTFLAIAAPEIVADYTELLADGTLTRAEPEAWFKRAFQHDQIGHPDLKTQHLLGACMFTRISDTEARGDWQARAFHRRKYKDGHEAQWDVSSFVEHTYLKVDGVWKFGGWRPHTISATVGNFDDVIGLLS
ncbi:hypothetical protein BKA63DRAFT_67655 [Paraphoma chrysanthemicola]|nr:hypothetical protein BKA63DRAFT_67655 [Paraphoma chrysanthemicola]